MEEHAATLRGSAASGDPGTTATGVSQRRSREDAAARGRAPKDTEERRREPKEGRRAGGKAEGRREPALPRDARLQLREGHLRSGPVRLRGFTRGRGRQRREEAADRGAGSPEPGAARAGAAKGRSRQGGGPEAARRVHGSGRDGQQTDRGDQRRADATQ